jgi:hydroxyacylglutathione hydrolase
MPFPLEDQFTDVIGKAQRGLGVDDETLAKRAGLKKTQMLFLKAGDADDAVLEAVAAALKLKADALRELAHKAWRPAPVTVAGLAAVTTRFEDMTVNAYVIFDPVARVAAIVDTGADATPILDFLKKEKLETELILLTHTHGDHVLELDRLKEKTGARAFVGNREPLEGAESFDAGKEFSLGTLRIGTRLTWGHSRGGITYVVKGLSRPVAVVGDAIFAGSMGGGGVSYADALRCNREEILTLPEETVLCPGHGPITTVAEEKQHNPFFP